MPSPPPPSGSRDGPAGPRRRWWEGVASPGPAGYLLAVVVAVVALAVLSAVVEATAYAGPSGDAWSVLVVVLVAGAVVAVVVAPPGVLVVHLLTLRVRAQWVHVVVTALVGAVTGLLVTGSPDVLVALLATSVALGRAAVVPLVPGVGRRRRTRHDGPGRDVADFGPDGPAG